jgi:hypothetical protein
MLKKREDATVPDKGWPWPWKTSHTTDYSYVFNKRLNRVIVNDFKRIIKPSWETKKGEYHEQTPFKFKFPIMDTSNYVQEGRRSGIGIIKFDGKGGFDYVW